MRFDNCRLAASANGASEQQFEFGCFELRTIFFFADSSDKWVVSLHSTFISFPLVRSKRKIRDPPSELLALSNFTLFNRLFAVCFFVSFSLCSVLHSAVDDIVNGGTYASPYRILSSSEIIQTRVQLLLLLYFLLVKSGTITCRGSAKAVLPLKEYWNEIKLNSARHFGFEHMHTRHMRTPYGSIVCAVRIREWEKIYACIRFELFQRQSFPYECNFQHAYFFSVLVRCERELQMIWWNICMRMPPTVITAFWRKLCSSVRVDWLDRGRNCHRRPLQWSLSHTLLPRIDKVVDYRMAFHKRAHRTLCTDRILGTAVVGSIHYSNNYWRSKETARKSQNNKPSLHRSNVSLRLQENIFENLSDFSWWCLRNEK